jgi:hypothetical protein
VIFLLKYHQNTQETACRKKEKKERICIEKKRKKKRKKKKSSKSLFKERGSQYSKTRKTLQHQNLLFDVISFSPPPSYHIKDPFQNH